MDSLRHHRQRRPRNTSGLIPGYVSLAGAALAMA
jgi:hypothetical protein